MTWGSLAKGLFGLEGKNSQNQIEDQIGDQIEDQTEDQIGGQIEEDWQLQRIEVDCLYRRIHRIGEMKDLLL